MYVADWRNDRIQRFSPDGEFIASYGESGNGDGQLHRPASAAVDADGYVYVADWGNDRVQVFDSDGGFVQKLMGEGEAPRYIEKLFWQPTAVKLDAHGRLYVVDRNRHRIQVYERAA